MSSFAISGQWDFGGAWCKVNSIINIGIWIEHIILFAILKENIIKDSLLQDLSWFYHCHMRARITIASFYLYSIDRQYPTFNDFPKMLQESKIRILKGRQSFCICSPHRQISSCICQQSNCDSSSFMAGIFDHIGHRQCGIPLLLWTSSCSMHSSSTKWFLFHLVFFHLFNFCVPHCWLLCNNTLSKKGKQQWTFH